MYIIPTFGQVDLHTESGKIIQNGMGELAAIDTVIIGDLFVFVIGVLAIVTYLFIAQ